MTTAVKSGAAVSLGIDHENYQPRSAAAAEVNPGFAGRDLEG